MDSTASAVAFLASLRDRLTDEQVVTSGPEFDLLAKDPVVNAKKPHAFVFPDTREQVQYVVAKAAAAGVKLWPYSAGKNWGYLNTCAGEAGVVVNLRRMTRILHVDDELAYAIIEPGVTYDMLSRHLADKGFRLWTDSPGGPPTGSVIGNALDRGVGVTRYADHSAHICGLEVVLADGGVLRTGVAREDGPAGAAHLYKWGVGPYVEGLFSQSNLGIVTQAGIWLMREPADYRIFSAAVQDDDSLASCMDTVRELMLEGVIPETGRFSNDTAMLTLVTQAIEEGFSPKEVISRADLAALKSRYSIPGWTSSFAIYGQPEIVAACESIARRRLQQGGSCERINSFSRKRAARLRRVVAHIDRHRSRPLSKVMNRAAKRWFGTSLEMLRLFPGLIDIHEGKPVETVVRRGYFRYARKRPDRDIHVGRDDIGILWSVPVCPFRGQEVVSFIRQCRDLFESFSFDFYMTVMVFNARSVCPLMAILYDRLDPEESERAARLYDSLLDLSHRLGYQHFRSGINGWRKLYQHAPENKRINQKLKAALDPQGVFAPGRYGID